VARRKFAGGGFGRIFAKDLMVDAKEILKWRSYFFDEGEPEIKTALLQWLGKATEETDKSMRWRSHPRRCDERNDTPQSKTAGFDGPCDRIK
jgi:hypothetical protein